MGIGVLIAVDVNKIAYSISFRAKIIGSSAMQIVNV